LVEHDGEIIVAGPDTGIVIRRSDNGEEFAIPPALDHRFPAQPDDYKLHATGRVVSSPDLIATFDIHDSGGESD